MLIIINYYTKEVCSKCMFCTSSLADMEMVKCFPVEALKYVWTISYNVDTK